MKCQHLVYESNFNNLLIFNWQVLIEQTQSLCQKKWWKCTILLIMNMLKLYICFSSISNLMLRKWSARFYFELGHKNYLVRVRKICEKPEFVTCQKYLMCLKKLLSAFTPNCNATTFPSTSGHDNLLIYVYFKYDMMYIVEMQIWSVWHEEMWMYQTVLETKTILFNSGEWAAILLTEITVAGSYR